MHTAIDEQDFIDAFVRMAKHPVVRNDFLQSRRVAVFGRPFNWKSDVTHELSKLPESFNAWCVENSYTDFNSVVVNVYDECSRRIDWHTDDVRNVTHGHVVSASFAIERHNRHKTLAHMEFRFPDRSDSTGKTMKVKTEPLSHGTVVRFDAIAHKRKRCAHRVPRTLFGRVNVTLRKIAK